MAKVTKKRLTIAFFTTELEGDYSEALYSGITDAAEENDVNLVVLPGKALKMPYTNQYNYNVIYEFINHKNVDALVMSSAALYGPISRKEFTAFCLRYKPLPLVSIGVPIEGVPSVLIDNRVGLKQIINHLINTHHKRRIAFIKGPDGHNEAEERLLVYREILNENGLDYDPNLVIPGDFTVFSVDKAIKTLIDERKVSYDAIVASNDEMALGVLEALKKRNILVPKEVAVTGFDNGEGTKYSSPSLTTVKQPIYDLSKKALEMALEIINGKRPDNIILNTEIVIRESCGCLSETIQFFNSTYVNREIDPVVNRNLKLGENIDTIIEEIFGQNDTIKLDFLKTLITDCFQVFTQDNLELQETEKLLGRFNSNIDVSNLTDNDIITIQKTVTFLKEWIISIVADKSGLIVEDFFQKIRIIITETLFRVQRKKLNACHLQIRYLRGLLVEMVSRSYDYREQLQKIIPILRSMGIKNCFVYLYDKPIVYHLTDTWHNPRMVNLVMAYKGEDWILQEICRFPGTMVLKNKFLPKGKRSTFMLNPLFVEDEHLGLILLEFNVPDNYMFESIVFEMSCALKLSILFHEREQIENRLQEAVNELAEYNERLSNISQTDELTGLYNRRGFMNLANQSLNLARKRGKNGLLFFADIDDLKQINDRYGHDEGDLAIKAMGEILAKTFRASDIIARLGGDEFTILAIDSSLKILPKIEERLSKFTKEYNLQLGKPYQLAISIGAVPFQSNECVTLENLMSQADNYLYEQKKQKRKQYPSG